MKEIRKEDIKQEVFDLYDYYVHGKIDRRGFMNRLSVYAVGGLTVSALMSYMMPNYAQAQQVKPDDSRIKIDMQGYKLGVGNKRIGKLPIVTYTEEQSDETDVIGRDEYDVRYEIARWFD